MGKGIWISGAAAIACTGALLSTPAAAHGSIGVAPPQPAYPYHYQPPPRPVWVPGHWEWQGNRHTWVHGHYVQPPYHGDRWARRGDRDLDNDGVRNRHDRDRDGDGVRNWHDRAPDNRYRR